MTLLHCRSLEHVSVYQCSNHTRYDSNWINQSYMPMKPPAHKQRNASHTTIKAIGEKRPPSQPHQADTLFICSNKKNGQRNRTRTPDPTPPHKSYPQIDCHASPVGRMHSKSSSAKRAGRSQISARPALLASKQDNSRLHIEIERAGASVGGAARRKSAARIPTMGKEGAKRRTKSLMTMTMMMGKWWTGVDVVGRWAGAFVPGRSGGEGLWL